MSKPNSEVSITDIKRDAAEWIRLKQDVWRIYDEGRADPSLQSSREHMAADERAVAAYRAFRPSSGLDFRPDWGPFVANNIREIPYMLEFAIAFLEFDPRYFRSGYLKARFLQRIRGCPLSESQKDRLNVVLLDAAQKRGGREYRRYCRLAARIASDGLCEELARMSKESGSAASRARMMLDSIRG